MTGSSKPAATLAGMSAPTAFPPAPAHVVRPDAIPASALRVELPASEVCMHMRVAGSVMWVEPLEHDMAQLWTDEGTHFSFPITAGEAGLHLPSSWWPDEN